MFGLPTLLIAFAVSAAPTDHAAVQQASNSLQLIMFEGPDCPACDKIRPLINDFQSRNWPIRVVDAYSQPQLAEQFKIQNIPTFVLLDGTREVDRFVGAPDPVVFKPQLIAMFNKAHESINKRSEPIDIPISDNPISHTNFPPPSDLARPSAAIPPRGSALEQSVNGLLSSSVRIRIEDPKGFSWGTGTIVDTNNGEALILTCAHIFKGSQGNGIVEIHLFQNDPKNPVVKVPGRCIEGGFDLENDIAFVVIKPPFSVKAIPIATVDNLQPNQRLVSVGCDGGADPTVKQHIILSLDRFRTPSQNSNQFSYICVSGAPVQGRSGGGLFSEDGYLVGVCNTGDPNVNDGLFVPPHVIRQQLDRMGFSVVYKNPSLVDSTFDAQPKENILAAAPVNISEKDAVSGTSPSLPSNLSSIALVGGHTPQKTDLTSEEQATIDEIRRRQADGAEIIVIVNPARKGNEKPQSEVIKLSNVSDKFIETLTGR